MVKAWREIVTIPTYEVGKPEKNPMFLEKRVYQGSSGVVYPYPVIESISDKKTDKDWKAVWLENEYIKVMILPELGGRIQMAYDKIKQRHFVYYNHVIKPALVGLVGPWISGGIERGRKCYCMGKRDGAYVPSEGNGRLYVTPRLCLPRDSGACQQSHPAASDFSLVGQSCR